MTEIFSPLTGSSKVVLEKEISCKWLIANYQHQLGIDVRKYVSGLETIQVYKCLETGFRFYYPFNLDGDGAFYEILQKFDWYYMDWKWEHEVTRQLLKPTDSLLEIGCGRGGFLQKVQGQVAEAVGLELNASAAEAARARGVQAQSVSIQDYAKRYPAQFDLVCSFQVVEHIAQVRSFMEASLATLKPGGSLIVSVPNNDSVVVAPYPHNLMNMPPHHMGLWNLESLIKLPRVLPIDLVNIYLEPLQSYHRGFADDLVMVERAERLQRRYGFVGRLYHRYTKGLISLTTMKLSKYIIGHSILAHYVKRYE